MQHHNLNDLHLIILPKHPKPGRMDAAGVGVDVENMQAKLKKTLSEKIQKEIATLKNVLLPPT